MLCIMAWKHNVANDDSLLEYTCRLNSKAAMALQIKVEQLSNSSL